VVSPADVAAGRWADITTRRRFLLSVELKIRPTPFHPFECPMSDAIDWLQTSTPGLLLLCLVAIACCFPDHRIKLEPFISLLARPVPRPGRRLNVRTIVGTRSVE